ncbi:hypothetical protein LTR50_001374 [Elasticomyces elasticus]|nr:hypothetical protein LTR50_001374 [Elasticomyces elasticus]
MFGEMRFNIWVGPVLPKVVAKNVQCLSVHGPLGDFTTELLDITVDDSSNKEATTKRTLTRAVANKNSTYNTNSVDESGNESDINATKANKSNADKANTTKRKPRGAMYVHAVAVGKKLEADETILCLRKYLGNLIKDRDEWSPGVDDWTDVVDICKGTDREYGYGGLGR